MVRQEEQRSNPESWLLIDTMRGRQASDERFDRAVELAASVAAHLLDLGYQVAVHETGEPQLGGTYELPGGDTLLLHELASLEQTREPDGDYAGKLSLALRGGHRAAPVFMVMVDGDPESWRDLESLTRYADPAVAFLLTPSARTAEPWLEAAGWACVAVEESTDAASAWARARQAQHDRQRARSGASGVR